MEWTLDIHDPTTITSNVCDDVNKEIYIYDEVYSTGMLIDDIFQELEEHDLLKTDIVADSANPLIIAELKKRGVRRIRGAKKPKGSIESGIDFLSGYRIIIHPSCVHTIEEFNTYTFKQDKEGNWLNEPVDANNHIIDPTRYSLEEHIIKQKVSVKTFRGGL